MEFQIPEIRKSNAWNPGEKREAPKGPGKGGTDWAKCVVCKKGMGEGKEKDFQLLVPCLHLVCSLECLRKCGVPGDGGGSTTDKCRCPDCLQSFDSTKKFPVADILGHVVTGSNTTERLRKKCGWCIRPQSLASKKCLQCNILLCASCVREHLMMIVYKDHNVSDSSDVFFEANQSEICRLHPGFIREKYCANCDLTLCRVCMAGGSHTGHDLQPLDDLKRTMVAETEELEKKTKNTKSVVRRLLNEVRSCHNRKIGCIQEKLMSDSREAFKHAVKIIEHQEQITMLNIRDALAEKAVQLLALKKQCLSAVAQLENLLALCSTLGNEEILRNGDGDNLTSAVQIKKNCGNFVQKLSSSDIVSIAKFGEFFYRLDLDDKRLCEDFEKIIDGLAGFVNEVKSVEKEDKSDLPSRLSVDMVQVASKDEDTKEFIDCVENEEDCSTFVVDSDSESEDCGILPVNIKKEPVDYYKDKERDFAPEEDEEKEIRIEGHQMRETIHSRNWRKTTGVVIKQEPVDYDETSNSSNPLSSSGGAKDGLHPKSPAEVDKESEAGDDDSFWVANLPTELLCSEQDEEPEFILDPMTGEFVKRADSKVPTDQAESMSSTTLSTNTDSEEQKSAPTSTVREITSSCNHQQVNANDVQSVFKDKSGTIEEHTTSTTTNVCANGNEKSGVETSTMNPTANTNKVVIVAQENGSSSTTSSALEMRAVGQCKTDNAIVSQSSSCPGDFVGTKVLVNGSAILEGKDTTVNKVPCINGTKPSAAVQGWPINIKSPRTSVIRTPVRDPEFDGKRKVPNIISSKKPYNNASPVIPNPQLTPNQGFTSVNKRPRLLDNYRPKIGSGTTSVYPVIVARSLDKHMACPVSLPPQTLSNGNTHGRNSFSSDKKDSLKFKICAKAGSIQPIGIESPGFITASSQNSILRDCLHGVPPKKRLRQSTSTDGK